MRADAHKDQQRASNSLEILAVVICPAWVLGTELKSSAKAVYDLKHKVVFIVSLLSLLN